jgi:7-dehydrocholesterol reductase
MSDWSSTPSNFLTRTIVPLLLITITPPFAMIFWHVNVELNGSFLNLWNEILEKGILSVLQNVWLARFFGTPTAWKMIAVFAALERLPQKETPLNIPIMA